MDVVSASSVLDDFVQWAVNLFFRGRLDEPFIHPDPFYYSLIDHALHNQLANCFSNYINALLDWELIIIIQLC